MGVVDPQVLESLAAGAEAADTTPAWPAASWDALRRAGVLGWGVPRKYGGQGLTPQALAEGHEALAGACLTTTFILSQREAALRRVLASPTAALRERYLPALVRGEQFLTVGLSQLTTSRQHRAPALVATPDGAGYRLDGEAPWVTGADAADALVLGATLPNGGQALFVVPMALPGVSVGPPLPLVALAGSRTVTVHCDGVALGADYLLAGPAERVLGPAGGGGLETSCLALGLAGAAIAALHQAAAVRADLAAAAAAFAAEQAAVRQGLHHLAASPPDLDAILALRVRASRLALRATQAGLVAAKGAGFTTGHPAGRWARQALFFLVWSCPRSVSEGLLAELVPA